MSDWEDSSDDTPIPTIVKPVKKWDDEDVDENAIKDSWDMESSDEEKEKAKTTTTPAPPPKKKKSAAQKVIADAVKREQMNNNYGNEEEDELERKKRERQAIKDSDLENTKGMFQGISIKETEVDKINSKDLNSEGMSRVSSVSSREKDPQLDKINPRSKEEFDEFSKLLVERIRKHEKQSMYANFINEFVRELCVPLKDADVRKVANTLSTLANEKQKQIREKEKPKKKGKAKPSLQVDKFDSVDITDYGTYDDFDDDDFM